MDIPSTEQFPGSLPAIPPGFGRQTDAQILYWATVLGRFGLEGP